MKKAGWNPKKGVVEPKPEVGVAGQTAVSSEFTAGSESSQGQPSSTIAQAARTAAGAMKPANAAPTPGGTVGLSTTDKEQEVYEDVDLTTPKVYQRAVWKHVVHWVFFSILSTFFVAASGELVMNVFYGKDPGSLNHVLKGALLELMFCGLNMMVIPSLLLEANKVELRQDRLIVWNLIWRSTIPWKDVKSVTNPFYLKFAIIKTPRFFQLINKRDIKEFAELLAIVKAKAHHASER